MCSVDKIKLTKELNIVSENLRQVINKSGRNLDKSLKFKLELAKKTLIKIITELNST